MKKATVFYPVFIVTTIASSLYSYNPAHLTILKADLLLPTPTKNYQGFDLSEADLTGMDLSNANLKNANLSKIKGTKFVEQVVSPTTQPKSLVDMRAPLLTLKNANLEGTDLSEAVLEGINLQGANCKSANLTKARLTGSNISSVNFKNALLKQARINSRIEITTGPVDPVNFSNVGHPLYNKYLESIFVGDTTGADFSFANLQSIHISTQNLDGVSFKGADLTPSNDPLGGTLIYCELKGANFTGAKLDNGFIQHSQCQGASFVGASMKKTNVWSSDFTGADFRGADTTELNTNNKAILTDTTGLKNRDLLILQYILKYNTTTTLEKPLDFKGFNFSGADLTEKDLSGANLRGADLRGCKLEDTIFAGAQLQGADLRGSSSNGKTDFTGAGLQGADLRGVFTSWTKGSDTKWSIVDSKQNKDLNILLNILAFNESVKSSTNSLSPKPLNFRGFDLSGADLTGKDLSGANLKGADLRGCKLEGTIFEDAQLQGANLRGSSSDSKTDFSSAELQGTDLRGVFMVRTKNSDTTWSIEDAKGLKNRDLIKLLYVLEYNKNPDTPDMPLNFNGFDLTGADLIGKDLTNAKLKGANLQGTDLRSTIFIGAQLQGADLKGARTNPTTDFTGATLAGTDFHGVSVGITKGADTTWSILQGT